MSSLECSLSDGKIGFKDNKVSNEFKTTIANKVKVTIKLPNDTLSSFNQT